MIMCRCCGLAAGYRPQVIKLESQSGGEMTDGIWDIKDSTSLEDAMHTVYASSDELKADIDRLVVQVEKLVAERTSIIAVLTAFYRSDITMSSLQPIFDLTRKLNPDLDERKPRVPSHHLDEVS